MNGTVWVLWNIREYDVFNLISDAQMIHSKICSRQSGVHCFMIIVYGYSNVDQRNALPKFMNPSLTNFEILVQCLLARPTITGHLSLKKS